jgi:hypothetical protein
MPTSSDATQWCGQQAGDATFRQARLAADSDLVAEGLARETGCGISAGGDTRQHPEDLAVEKAALRCDVVREAQVRCCEWRS